MAMEIHLLPIGNTSTHSWWIFQPAMLVSGMVIFMWVDTLMSSLKINPVAPVLAASQEGCHFSWSAHGQLEPGVANSRE